MVIHLIYHVVVTVRIVKVYLVAEMNTVISNSFVEQNKFIELTGIIAVEFSCLITISNKVLNTQ